MTKLNNRFYAIRRSFRILKRRHGSTDSPLRYFAPRGQPVLDRKGAVFLAMTCFMFGFRWIMESLLHWAHRPGIETLIMPVVVGTWCAFTAFKGGSVIIGQDFIEGRTLIGRWTFKKRIVREQIKAISENSQGLCIMDRGKFVARMLGFVFVPARLPEYQEIKSILSGWAPVQARR